MYPVNGHDRSDIGNARSALPLADGGLPSVRHGTSVRREVLCIMAVFGAPISLEDHAIRACLAALDIQRQASDLPLVCGRGMASIFNCGLD